MRAKIKSKNRGFFHATPEGDWRDSRDVFIHNSSCSFFVGAAEVGDIVEIGEVTEGPKGLRGHNVNWIERTV
jgi:hypothetical protein